MDPYQKSLLEQIVKQGEENSKILKGLQKNARWTLFFGILKWIIILVPAILAYYYLSPYWTDIKDFYAGFSAQIKSIGGFSEQLKNFDSMMRSFPKIPN